MKGSLLPTDPFLLGEGISMGHAISRGRGPFACGHGGLKHALPACTASPAQPWRTARGSSRVPVSPAPPGPPALLPGGPLIAFKSAKEGAEQMLIFLPLTPSLGATLQETSPGAWAHYVASWCSVKTCPFSLHACV